MSEARKARRALRAQRAAYFRSDPNGRAMVDRASAWLKTQSGFESATFALRRAVIIDLRDRGKCGFATFGDREVGGGIHLVDSSGRPLPLATLIAAKLRMKFRGGFDERS